MEPVIIIILVGTLLWSIVVDNPFAMYLIIAIIGVYILYVISCSSPKTKGINKLKPYPCHWCGCAFWTRKSCVRHEEAKHPTQKRNRTIYYQARKRARNPSDKNIHNPDAYLKPCTWCGGSGWKNGVMCDECGGTGKMFR